ncbi:MULTISPECIES: aldehyde dehydrogenase [unclassified Acinetobacter]|uniref:aldehyde dehydrogenase n=1 Tax=unclassified Acinetobacter TaxID=196816 RepID=UPI0029344C0A|nr:MULTISPECIES: aldehyde dehydrogenase [unclassified Acinetobacter]WOE32926.1 aldehyde dehydrogenase [Acinetobacter sp. SAAs470]WOE38403.1 aldehyde dehydrogenase [Acinetobacter sp. SAAs474]
MQNVELLIHGQSVAASSGKYFERISPIDGSIASMSAAATLDDVDRAIQSAHEAFQTWATLSPTDRRLKLLKAADLMDQKTEQFIQTAIHEIGSTSTWYGFNVHLAANMLREAAAMTTQIDGNIIPSDVPGNMAMGIRVPCGVIVGMAPWNAPVILATRALAMPLACGNTVVLKASEACPATHRLIGEVLHEAGIGDGVVNVITHAPEDAAKIVERLIQHPLTKRINFTGSTHVGRIIAEIAAKYLKPVLLELGGKAPVIVLEHADLDETVNAIVFGAFFNQGQICMSTERVLVDEKIAEKLIEKLINKIKTIHAGNPLNSHAPLGTLESLKAATRIQKLVEDAHDKGASIPLGLNIDGTVMQPTIVVDVTKEMLLYAEESFGPVCTVQRFKTVNEAIELANDSEFGLSSAVFSQNLAEALSVAKRIDSGICHINGATVHDEAQMPFGGVKQSGYGRFGSKASIAEFTELRWITIQTSPRHYPI